MYTIIYRFFLLTACFQALMPLNANQMQNLESRINCLVLVRIHCFSYQLQIRTIRCYRVLFALKSGFFFLQVAHAIHMREQRQKCVIHVRASVRIVDVHVRAVHAKQIERANELVLTLKNKTL